MDKVEHYKCEKCGTNFEITDTKRMSSFVMRKPFEWQCPTCGRMCYAKKDNTFTSSIGGKF